MNQVIGGLLMLSCLFCINPILDIIDYNIHENVKTFFNDKYQPRLKSKTNWIMLMVMMFFIGAIIFFN